ncbi:GNAT family N-acetyltransferase [Rhodospirillaceae bacterium SYSU D60014]|uniref:GNAT family N-acetyltransferase n=1 Tax=Virgifigura deserti TaxID=2268457 RepID=UPI0013C48C65
MPAPPSPLVIRAATPGDGERVAAMAAALSQDEGGPPSQFSAEAFCRDGFGQAPAFACLIAERDGATVGYALHYPDYDTDRLVHGAYLADLYVEKAARRAGVGRALMAAVARIGRERGARMMRWGVLQHNGAARLFYSGIGREQQDLRVCSVSGDRFRTLAEAAPRSAAIRPARPADAGALATMLEALNRELDCRPPRAGIEAALRADGFGPNAAFTSLFAERQGAPVGYALFLPAYDTETGARGAFLSDLYVMPRTRGHGLGRALIAAATRATTQRGGDFLYWEVLRTNTRARRFYRSLAGELEDVIICIAEGEAFERLAVDGGMR